MKRCISLLLLATFFAFAGCSEDEATAPTTAPIIPSLLMTTSISDTTTDNNALLSKSMFTVFNGLLSMSQMFLHATPASANGTYTWTFAASGQSWTMTAVRQTDGSYVWTLKFTGLDNDVQLTNFVFWSGTSSADGKTGLISFFEPGVTGASADVAWSVAANGAITVTLREYVDGIVDFKAVGTANTDGSGTLDIYDNGTIRSFHSSWNAAGAGTWTTYGIEGNITGSGSWT